MAAESIPRYKARLTALKGQRLPHEQVWKDCFDYSMPHLSVGWQGQTPFTAGEIQHKKATLLNGVAGEALTTSADGFMGGMVPANSLWFGLNAGRETDAERSWLSESALTIWENIHASNFDAESYDGVLGLLGAGWFCLYVDEDKDGGYYFENWPLAQCFIASSRMGGKVDTIYREFPVTVGELVGTYTMEKLSEAVQQMAKAGKVDEFVQMCWAIEPRADYLPGATLANRLPFASCLFEIATGHVVREGGFHEFPVIAPRWRRIPGSAYALGPMSDGLPDAKSVNEVQRWEFAAAETALAPPMVATDDGVLNPRSIKLGPRKIIVANSVDSIKPLLTGARVDFGQMMIADLEAKVRRSLMADLFDKILKDPSMTATQVTAILALIRQRMGPRFARLQSEWLQPLIERCYGIALRAGVLGEPPMSLRSRNYTIKYESPLARAQKSEEVVAIEAHEASLGAAAQADPGVLDTHDWQSAARRKAQLRGVPSDLTRDARAVEKLQQQRAAAAQQAQQQQAQADVQSVAANEMAMSLAGA